MRVMTWMQSLDADECVRLLEGSTLGRLGVVAHGRPEIFPVNHVYDRPSGCVIFPTRGGTKLHAALEWPWVAFEVDGMDADGERGWSVQMIGRAEELDDTEIIQRARTARTVRWAMGRNAHWVRIVPSEVTGRRITAVEE